MPADSVGQVERDGYEGILFENPETGKRFVSWKLAVFSAAAGSAITVTGVTGENGSPKAAAYNLQHGNTQFLRRVLRSRIQWEREAGSVVVSVPGAQILGTGYDEPLALKLEERIGSPRDLNLALSVMAGAIANVTARGVYARLNTSAAEDEGSDEVASIEF
jgi:hypothetical protein